MHIAFQQLPSPTTIVAFCCNYHYALETQEWHSNETKKVIKFFLNYNILWKDELTFTHLRSQDGNLKNGSTFKVHNFHSPYILVLWNTTWFSPTKCSQHLHISPYSSFTMLHKKWSPSSKFTFSLIHTWSTSSPRKCALILILSKNPLIDSWTKT